MKEIQRADATRYGEDYAYFRLKLKELSGIDLADYKDQQMYRRLDGFRRRKGIADFFAYGRMLQRDPDRFKELLDFLTINVSEFFRNPEQWNVLRERVLPEIVRALPGLQGVTAWSAGCAAGQEAYSLAMMLVRDYPGRRHTVLATDIDDRNLEKGRAGKYTDGEIAQVPAEFRELFSRTAEGAWEASPILKNIVSFGKLDLLRDRYPEGLDLILCRNVIIYFKEHGKDRVIRGLVSALRPGGFLFTGATEAVLTPAAYGLRQERPLFYRKIGDAAAEENARLVRGY